MNFGTIAAGAAHGAMSGDVVLLLVAAMVIVAAAMGFIFRSKP